MSIYLYAIARSGQPEIALPPGIAGQPVRVIESGPLCHYVSDCDAPTLRPERRNIAASQAVLRALQAEIDLLPMAFGTMAQSDSAAVELLERHRDRLITNLDRVQGAVEMGVRLNLDVPDAISHIVQKTPELLQARDRAFGGRKPPSHDERIRLGQLCEGTLRRYQQAQLERLVALLTPSCSAVTAMPLQDDRQLANLAALVPRDAVAAFEAAVSAAAEVFEDELTFVLNGPWPPYNFVQFDAESR